MQKLRKRLVLMLILAGHK